MDTVYYDQFGNYFDRYGAPLTLNDLIARGIDVVGAWGSRSPYISPDDPRYRGRNSPYVYPQGYPRNQGADDFSIGGSLNPRGGLSVNSQVSPWVLMLVGLGAGLLLFGKGRR